MLMYALMWVSGLHATVCMQVLRFGRKMVHHKYIENYINGEPYGNIIVASFMPKKEGLLLRAIHVTILSCSLSCSLSHFFIELFVRIIMRCIC